MSVKSDKWIQRMSERPIAEGPPLISPFTSSSISTNNKGKKIPSYGLSSYGYDISLGGSFSFFKNTTTNEDIWYLQDGKWLRRTVNGAMYDNLGELKSADKIFSFPYIDIAKFDHNLCEEFTDVESILLPPRGFMLGYSRERICMPRNVIAICTGKSTIARSAAHVVVTPLEPEWEGYITLEISNMTDLPIKFDAGIGITQLVFIETDEECKTSYSDRKGKYNNQPARPVHPR